MRAEANRAAIEAFPRRCRGSALRHFYIVPENSEDLSTVRPVRPGAHGLGATAPTGNSLDQRTSHQE